MSLEAGLAKEMEHIIFVGLNAGLVKGIDADQLGGESAGGFKEEDQGAERLGGLVGGDQLYDRDAAVAMGSHGSLKGLLVEFGKGLSLQVLKTV